MAFTFVIGKAKSQKSKRAYLDLINSAKNKPNVPHFLIVPEQFTLQSQKTLVSLSENSSVMDIDILSFERLAYKVLKSPGISDVNVLEETGKSLVVRRILKENKDRFFVLKDYTDRPGYIDEVKSLLSEMLSYRITPELIKKTIDTEGLSGYLKLKLSDMLIVLEEFTKYIHGKYVTSEMLLDLLYQNIDKSKSLKGSVFCFDKYTGFTPIQYAIIEKLSTMADLSFTVIMDAKEADFVTIREEELFYMSKNMISTLRRIADQAHIKTQNVLMEGESDSLGIDKNNNIEISFFDSPRNELLGVAQRIRELVKDGARYKNIAILTGSQQTYDPFIEEIFAEYDIPVFSDQTKTLGNHPLSRYLRSLSDIYSFDYQIRSVISFCKSSFSPISLKSAYLFENYLYATGIKGKSRYKKEFTKRPKNFTDEEIIQVNEIRARVFETLESLFSIVKGKDKETNVRDLSTGLFEFLESQKIQDILYERGEQEVFDLLVSMMEKIFTFLSDKEYTFKDYMDLLLTGFMSGKIGRLPSGSDMVIFGDSVRTRLEGIDTLFVIGVNEGLLPPVNTSFGIITDKEKHKLSKNGFVLAPDGREKLFSSNLYTYLMFSRPDKNLFISYALSDIQGEALRPSMLISQICDTYKVEPKEGRLTDLKGSVDLTGIQKALDDKRKHNALSKAVIDEIYGNNLHVSVSKLESYARCAYAYYLNYVLRLTERSIHGMNAADTGNIYHDALYRYALLLKERGLSMEDASPGERRRLVTEAAKEAYKSLTSTGDYESAYSDYVLKRIVDTLERTVGILTDQVKKGEFVPTHFETSLKNISSGEELRRTLSDGRNLILDGKIDRIDLSQKEDSVYIKIIDYKTGNKDFSLELLNAGLQIQLIYYLSAQTKALIRKGNHKTVVPSAIFYYKIDDPVNEVEKLLSDEQYNALLKKKLRPTGVIAGDETVYGLLDTDLQDGENRSSYESDVAKLKFNKDGSPSKSGTDTYDPYDIKLLMDFVDKKVIDTASDISRGKLIRNPYKQKSSTGCDFCSYHGICNFSERDFGDRYSEVDKIKDIREFKDINGI